VDVRKRKVFRAPADAHDPLCDYFFAPSELSAQVVITELRSPGDFRCELAAS